MRSMVEGRSLDGVKKARQLRRTMSPAERRLWGALRMRPGGFKFRKQHPRGPFTLDFFCHAAGLAIEIDGSSHDMGDRPQRDDERNVRLASERIKTLRILATDVRDELEAVVAHIVNECSSRAPSTGSAGPPPPENRGRR